MWRRGLTGSVGAALVLAVASCAPAPPSLAPHAPAPRAQTSVRPVSEADTGAAPTIGRPVLSPEGLIVPGTVDRSKPVTVVLALHGMGGNGERIAARLGDEATRNGWIVAAPSMAFRDYMDPEQVREDEREILPRLRAMLDDLPSRLPEGIRLAERVHVYGFSRGGQLAHRFAFFYPNDVASVAALSAGSYTLPKRSYVNTTNDERPLLFPFGVGDLERYAGESFDSQAIRKVSFLVGVGGADVAREQVPRLFDPYIGTTRVERAQRFSEALRALGVETVLEVSAGVAHEETSAMRGRAWAFLAARGFTH